MDEDFVKLPFCDQKQEQHITRNGDKCYNYELLNDTWFKRRVGYLVLGTTK